MDNVKRKLLSDLFGSPSTIVPVVVGATALLVSWAVGSVPGMLVGIAGVLGGVGLMATRWILNLERMTEESRRRLVEQEQAKHREELQQLEASLALDGDPRTETCLRHLHEYYEAFQKKAEGGELTVAGYEVTSRVERLFQACLDQLRRSHELWEQAHEFRGKAKQSILDEREEIVQEVAATTDHIQSAVAHFRRINDRQDDMDLGQLRDELDESLRVAKLVDERMAAWEDPLDRHPAEFE
jgi:hypothetical protein